MKNNIETYRYFDTIKMKSCTQCGEVLPATNEYFHKSKHTRDGLRWECKECVAKRDRERYYKKKAKLSPLKKFINLIKKYVKLRTRN
jgi:hypothetical protein